MAEEYVRAIIMLEILGRPAEYIIESMESIIKKIGEEKGVRLVSKKIHEAKNAKNSENLFTTFAEIEVCAESIDVLFRIIFTYNPSHVEVLHPAHIVLANSSLSLVANEIISRLHKYDEIAKILTIENNILTNKLRQAGISMNEMPQIINSQALRQKTKLPASKIIKKKKTGRKIKRKK